MNTDQFVAKYTGQQLEQNNGGYKGECVSLAKRYAQEVQGVPDADTVLQVPKGARQLYEGFNWNGKMAQYYDKIPYGQPRQRGDLVVWGSNLGSYGDVAIALDSGTQMFGQFGTPIFQPARIRNETRQPLGYLRNKGGIMGVKIVGAPAAAGKANGRIDVFVRGSDNNLYQKYFNQSGWSTWVKVGSGMDSPPSVSSPYGDERVDVFFTGVSGDLVHTYFDGKNWTDNESLGTPN